MRSACPRPKAEGSRDPGSCRPSLHSARTRGNGRRETRARRTAGTGRRRHELLLPRAARRTPVDAPTDSPVGGVVDRPAVRRPDRARVSPLIEGQPASEFPARGRRARHRPESPAADGCRSSVGRELASKYRPGSVRYSPGFPRAIEPTDPRQGLGSSSLIGEESRFGRREDSLEKAFLVANLVRQSRGFPVESQALRIEPLGDERPPADVDQVAGRVDDVRAGME